MAHILIVDDSPTELHVMKVWLEKHGFLVSTAGSGEDGIERARQNKPDLILMDVVMPGLNGFQATRQLTRDPVTGDIPVVIISTKHQDTDRLWGLRQGAKEYLSKPVTEQGLVDTVNRILQV